MVPYIYTHTYTSEKFSSIAGFFFLYNFFLLFLFRILFFTFFDELINFNPQISMHLTFVNNFTRALFFWAFFSLNFILLNKFQYFLTFFDVLYSFIGNFQAKFHKFISFHFTFEAMKIFSPHQFFFFTQISIKNCHENYKS